MTSPLAKISCLLNWRRDIRMGRRQEGDWRPAQVGGDLGSRRNRGCLELESQMHFKGTVNRTSQWPGDQVKEKMPMEAVKF